MRKKLIVVILCWFCAVLVFSQEKPRLGILPFTGGTGGEGETIAMLFSFQSDILDAFTVVPRTSAVNAIIAEQNFQLSGYTDSDTIVRLGRLLNADFVLSGHIRRLGDRNLVIATIVNVETFEQMAGEYRTYRNIEEIREFLPEMSQRMITASRQDTSGLPTLAIAPFNIANTGVNVHDAETLALILAVEIANTGKYAVLPRTAAMQSALTELQFQRSGFTAEEEVIAMGQAINAEYVLFGAVRRLGNVNMFTASILHVEDGRQVAGGTRDYRVVADGITLMEGLARVLSGLPPLVDRSDRLWTIGVSIGSSFADPWVIGTLKTTLAPFRNSFFRIGFDFGIVSSAGDAGYYSLFPFVHYNLFLPFRNGGGWYAGIGGGYKLAEYDFPEGRVSKKTFAAEVITGFNIKNMIDISYTLRTNFTGVSHKISVGYTYRFRSRR